MELGKIIDDNSDDDTDNINATSNKNGGEALSKGGILEKVSGWKCRKSSVDYFHWALSF